MKEIVIERECARNTCKKPLMRLSAYAGKFQFNLKARRLLGIHAGDAMKFYQDNDALFLRVITDDTEDGIQFFGTVLGFTHKAMSRWLCTHLGKSEDSTLYFLLAATDKENIFSVQLSDKRGNIAKVKL